MLLDAQNLFSDEQAVTAAAVSDNIIDLGAVRDIGTGERLYVAINVDVAMTDSGSDSTLTVSLYGDSTTTITPDGQQDLLTIPATSAAGANFFASLDPLSAPLQYRYIALYYTPNNGNLTTGTFTSALIHGIEEFTAYADNITIS